MLLNHRCVHIFCIVWWERRLVSPLPELGTETDYVTSCFPARLGLWPHWRGWHSRVCWGFFPYTSRSLSRNSLYNYKENLLPPQQRWAEIGRAVGGHLRPLNTDWRQGPGQSLRVCPALLSLRGWSGCSVPDVARQERLLNSYRPGKYQLSRISVLLVYEKTSILTFILFCPSTSSPFI